MATTYVIIGGGVAGTTAAETIRSRDPNGRILIISEEPFRFYSRVMLSKPEYFLEKIPFEDIFLRTTAWYEKQRIEFLPGRIVTQIHVEKKTVEIDDGSEVAYDKLLIATGTCANELQIPGADLQGIYYLRTLDDARAIIAAMKKAKSAVVIGGGFIGFELCDLFRQKKMNVTLVIREKTYWDPLLDPVSGQLIEAALTKGGVRLEKEQYVTEFRGRESVTHVVTDSGKQLSSHMVAVGVGAFCDMTFLRGSGIATKRGILTSEYMETNVKDIWAAGDAAEYKDLTLDEYVMMGNWVNAQMQGRSAAMNMVGQRAPFKFVSFYTTQGLGTTLAFVGDVRPDSRETIVRHEDHTWRTRILVEKDEIVGATMINRTSELHSIGKLIQMNVKVSTIRDQLADPKVVLKELVASLLKKPA